MEDNPFNNLKDEIALLRQEKIKQRQSLVLEYDEFMLGLLQNLKDTFNYYFPIVGPKSELIKENFLEWNISGRESSDPGARAINVISVKLIFDQNYKPVSFDCRYGVPGPNYGTAICTKATKEDLINGIKELYRKL